MDNGEMYKMIVEQLNDRMDRLDTTIRHLFDNQSVVCKDHNDRLDNVETAMAVIKDRQKQAEKRSNKVAIGSGSVATIISTALSHFMKNWKY